jgi:hypothetical protein
MQFDVNHAPFRRPTTGLTSQPGPQTKRYARHYPGKKQFCHRNPTNRKDTAEIRRKPQPKYPPPHAGLRDHQQQEHTDGHYLENRNKNEPENKRQLHPHPAEGNGQKPPPISTATSKRGRDGDRTLSEGKNGKSESKRPAGGSKGQISISGLQPEMHYHALLNEHIRSAYPNISNISPDMLKTLDLPKQLLDAQNTNGKHRQKEEKSKVPQLLRSIKGGKEGKEELKPFKRQSYHVAIAYHIHLKRIKTTNPSPNEIDPTYAARKLRESQNPTSSKH